MKVGRSVSMDTKYWEAIEKYAKKKGKKISYALEDMLDIAIENLKKEGEL